MERYILFFYLIVIIFIQLIQNGVCDGHSHIDHDNLDFLNRTTPSERQLYDFGFEHRVPIGVITTSSGIPVDIRDTTALNVHQFKNQFLLDGMTNMDNSEIPQRTAMSKGTGAWGYFEVNHDVSMYTSADVFNGEGKITPAFVRFSTFQHKGGSDLTRVFKGMSVKLFTKEGVLDFVNLHMPFFFTKDAILGPGGDVVQKGNPVTQHFDLTIAWDLYTREPQGMTAVFFFNSDYGLPNGYRKADYYPIHTYELRNSHGDRYFVRFNFRTCQGIENLSTHDARMIQSRELHYYNKDLYDSIEEKRYPAWDLEMYVMTYEEILHCDFDPFDITRLWEKGSYRIVPIGRLVLNKNPENHFRDVEQSAFNCGNLVPGIPGPIDSMFRARQLNYRGAQAYRLGVNYNRIHVNIPLYRKEYNRDGKAPVLENGKDAPSYYPNSFNGPVPYVEESRPENSLSVLQSKAVDLGPISYFYHHFINTEMHKQRFINNTVDWLLPVAPFMQKRVIFLYSLVDPDLGHRLAESLLWAEHDPGFAPPHVLIPEKQTIM